MSQRAIDLNSKDSYQLVKFSWNSDTEFATYTDWTSDLIGADGLTYVSRPTMEVRLPKNTGDLADDSCTIELSLEAGFLTDMTNGLPHASVDVKITEVYLPSTASPQRTSLITHQGTIIEATRNANNRKNNVRLLSKLPKARLNVSMGQPCNIQCGNSLGVGRCNVDMSNGVNSFFGTIASITGRTVTINFLSFTNPDPKYFHRGSILFAGLQIMIRDWSSSDPTTFVLVRQPPSSWLGASVFVSSGCDKSIETCRARYNKEDRFKGEGYAMPGYLPIMSTS